MKTESNSEWEAHYLPTAARALVRKILFYLGWGVSYLLSEATGWAEPGQSNSGWAESDSLSIVAGLAGTGRSSS